MDLKNLTDAIRTALADWHRPQSTSSPFAGLHLFQQALGHEARTPHQATNALLHDLVETLKTEDSESAVLLTRRFFDGEPVDRIIFSLNISESTFHRRRKEAIERLALLLQAQEQEARTRQRTVLEKRLERATYTALIGFEEYQADLAAALVQAGPPWLVSLEGIGGIGKTSLAHAISHQLIQQSAFEDFGWVSARPQLFELKGAIMVVQQPALSVGELVDQLLVQLRPDLPHPERLSSDEAHHLLKTRLKQNRHLIVIDNLETVEGLAELLPALCDLANPSKFLLTSREHFYHDCAIHHFQLPELNQSGALRLLRHEIGQHNLTHLAQADDDDLAQIYQTVGGNPLALRLVVGQTHIFALADILADLRQARSQSVEELYTFIYWRAWNSLTEPARVLFLTMPLLTEAGESFADLVQLSELEPATVQTSLKRLVELNLVNSLGDHQARRYTIHNLTRTFLQEQILKWK